MKAYKIEQYNVIVAASYKLDSLLHKCRWRAYYVYIPKRKQKRRLYFN